MLGLLHPIIPTAHLCWAGEVRKLLPQPLDFSCLGRQLGGVFLLQGHLLLQKLVQGLLRRKKGAFKASGPYISKDANRKSQWCKSLGEVAQPKSSSKVTH